MRTRFNDENRDRQSMSELAADPESRVIRQAEARRRVLEQQLAEVSRWSAEAQYLRGPAKSTGVPRAGLTWIPCLDGSDPGGGPRPLSFVVGRPQAMLHGAGVYLKPILPPTAQCEHVEIRTGANDREAYTVCHRCQARASMPKYSIALLNDYNEGRLEYLPRQIEEMQTQHQASSASPSSSRIPQLLRSQSTVLVR